METSKDTETARVEVNDTEHALLHARVWVFSVKLCAWPHLCECVCVQMCIHVGVCVCVCVDVVDSKLSVFSWRVRMKTWISLTTPCRTCRR